MRRSYASSRCETVYMRLGLQHGVAQSSDFSQNRASQEMLHIRQCRRMFVIYHEFQPGIYEIWHIYALKIDF